VVPATCSPVSAGTEADETYHSHRILSRTSTYQAISFRNTSSSWMLFDSLQTNVTSTMFVLLCLID